jgi:Zn-finger protein
MMYYIVIMKNTYKFFENKACKYHPCHFKGQNCLFCYCPLYLHKDCRGQYELLDNGVKDCTSCTLPHLPENYDSIVEVLGKIRNIPYWRK